MSDAHTSDPTSDPMSNNDDTPDPDVSSDENISAGKNETPPVPPPPADPEESSEPERAERRKPPRWRQVLALTGAGLLVLAGVFGGGVVTGWWLADERMAQQTAEDAAEIVEVEVPAFGVEEGAVMPDLRGLAESDALQVLADAGIPRDVVTVRTRPAAGASDIVIEQHPVFGTADPQGAQLVVSSEAVVPDVVGRASDKAVAELESLGARVVVSHRYVPGTDAGTVLETTPDEGEPVSDEVTLEVAEAASSVFLAALDPVEGGCSTGEVSVNGTTYADSLTCYAGEEPEENAWVIARAAESISGIVGVPDDGDPDVRVSVDVLADGEIVGSATATYGSPAEIDASVSGALRLTVRTRLLNVSDDGPYSADVTLADVRLVGGGEALDALIENPD